MHYNYESPSLMMPTTRQTKMLGLGIAAIAFLLATIPVFHSGVLYADEGDHGDHDNGDMTMTMETMTMETMSTIVTMETMETMETVTKTNSIKQI
jgi:hypothetical protein